MTKPRPPAMSRLLMAAPCEAVFFFFFFFFFLFAVCTPHAEYYMGKAHKNCIIGQQFCLHHITGTAFIIRLKLYAYIVENSETFQKIYSFMHFK